MKIYFILYNLVSDSAKLVKYQNVLKRMLIYLLFYQKTLRGATPKTAYSVRCTSIRRKNAAFINERRVFNPLQAAARLFFHYFNALVIREVFQKCGFFHCEL